MSLWRIIQNLSGLSRRHVLGSVFEAHARTCSKRQGHIIQNLSELKRGALSPLLGRGGGHAADQRLWRVDLSDFDSCPLSRKESKMETGAFGWKFQDQIQPLLDDYDRQIDDIRLNGAEGQLARMQVMNGSGSDRGATDLYGKDAGYQDSDSYPAIELPKSGEVQHSSAAPRVSYRIDPDTVLPDGSTVGARVNALADDINNRAQFTFSPYGPALQIGNRSDPVAVAHDVYQGTNFRKEFGGPGANYPFLGDAGNYAYGGVSAQMGVPLDLAEGVAGGYSLIQHKIKDWGWPYGMDPSARYQIPKAYEVPWKKP